MRKFVELLKPCSAQGITQRMMNSGDLDIQASRQEALARLRAGELVAFPTETVYGLGADATQDKAVAKIFEAKGRPTFNPLISHCCDMAMTEAHGLFSELALKLAEAFWPGPLTLVVQKREASKLSPLVSAGLPSVALRIPKNEHIRDIIQQLGSPVAAPSANRSGDLSPTEAKHVETSLNDRVSYILDGGPCPVGLESTVVDVSTDRPILLRHGGLSKEEIEDTVGHVLGEATHEDASPKSPGMLLKHYAPRIPLRIGDDPKPGEAVLAFTGFPGADEILSPSGDLTEAAANLFAALHRLDDAEVFNGIVVLPVPDEGLGRAINDRLRRAAER